ncbi:MAG: hypothetical protein IPP66_14195 [Anaerolineales bacterium]|nr:hypothetical protein [Anaerolineales bacterium]
MGKYTSRSSKPQAPTTKERTAINPYMRGIGCLFMLVVPVFSYGVGDYLAGQNLGNGILPPEWYGYMSVPPALANFTGLNYIANFFATRPHLIATLVLALVALVVVGGIVSIIYGYMYSIMGPSRYGPMDVPAPRIKTKKYRR